ncbi:Outer membrane protein beta-barrel domain-containing protein [Duganella sp. CF458]|uniref:outer membrane beta-barrel protein n=1 Tax=Duganella sp. CF458 TaxID=1884368 RepID=UPI0008E5B6DA|nr:outer membrane beta-barrel protein [Duganella sp. CF458]SFG22496.1 Outer membrane protein beta-barrel domain-containing protein [Duganella sp. CF458]
MKKAVFALAALAIAASAHAQDSAIPAKTVRPFVGIGATAGGDKLATAEYTNGNTASIRAGSGVYFTGGMEFRINEEFSAQTSVNFHVDNQSARNGNLQFQRFPIEALAFYHIDQHWKIGTGLRYVTGAKLSGSGVGEIDDVKFDNTVSPVVEAEYMFTPQISVKVRYVNEKLEVKREYGQGEVKANHVGISGNFYF